MNKLQSIIGLVPFIISCAAPRPSQFVNAPDEQTIITPQLLLKSARIPHSNPLVTFAHHTWFDWQDKDGQWWRLEVNTNLRHDRISFSDAKSDIRWEHPVEVLRVWEGVEVLEITKEMVAHVDSWDNYDAWPGPNSNTFVAEILRALPELNCELHHNAVGKDWPRANYYLVGPTTSATGVEMKIPYLGLTAGLNEGVEINFLGLTAGFSIWPTAIKIPCLPRIGLPIGVAEYSKINTGRCDDQ